jgi:hypothetical protein
MTLGNQLILSTWISRSTVSENVYALTQITTAMLYLLAILHVRRRKSNMIYNLGRYRYDRGKIYKKVWWFIFKCIDKGPYCYLEGVKIVNKRWAIDEGGK